MARESRIVLLPTRSSTASSRLAIAAAAGCDDPYACVHRHVDGSPAEGGGAAPNQYGLPLGDFEVAEQTGPCRRIGFRDCSKLGPLQIRLNERDVRCGRARIFGIAAIDGAAEAAHQGRHLGPDGELAAGTGFHEPDALNAAYLRSLSPLASTHMHLSVVDTERLDFNDDIASLGLRLRQLFVNKVLRAAEFLDDNGTHGVSPSRQVSLTS